MKVMICGKGGSGKSTLTTLIARTLVSRGKKVLVVDTDESNLCLHRLLGAEQPEIMMDAMGGRPGTREKLKQAADHQHNDDIFKEKMTFEDLPSDCLAETEGIKLLIVGKIKSYGEGCACMIGGISRAVLSRLQEKEDEIVLIDAEAGLEHFGRRIDANCDLVLSVIDPSFESIQMAERTQKIAGEAGVHAYFILNKTDESIRDAMSEGLAAERIIASIPQSRELFMQNLKGQPLALEIDELAKVCQFIERYRKPLSLNMKM